MKNYSIEELAKSFHKDNGTIRHQLKKGGYVPTSKVRRKHFYSIEAYYYLDSIYKKHVEIIEVPVYKNVYYEIIPSKMNYIDNL